MLRYGLLVLWILLLALGGYMGYIIYPRFELPPLEGVGLFVLAITAGIASFFSPCSFPLLLTFLARSGKSDKSDTLRFGLALAAGACAFLMLVGGLIALGGGAFFGQITFNSAAGRWLRFFLGAFLVFLGIAQLGFLTLPFGKISGAIAPLYRARIRLRTTYPTLAFFLWGFSYVLGGFG